MTPSLLSYMVRWFLPRTWDPVRLTARARSSIAEKQSRRTCPRRRSCRRRPQVQTQRPDQWVQTQSKSELRFKVGGESANIRLMPMYQFRDQRYAVYWQTENPKKSS